MPPKVESLTDIVSLYRCLSCGRLRLCEKGNFHPWCLPCMYDQFDWSCEYDDITREQAERILKEEE
jgi:hypothetical protein